MDETRVVAKGALVAFAQGFLGALPNIIAFQYNPSELVRSLSQRRIASCGGGEPTQGEAFRVDGPPNETIQFKAEFDGDDLAMDGNPVTPLLGVRPALAALELLLYPKEQQGFGSMFASSGAMLIPPDELPLVLFVWGPGRVLPVRLSAMTVREQEFDVLLNCIRAEVDMTVEVLKRLPNDHPAHGFYRYTENQMRVVARTQLVNNAQSVFVVAFGALRRPMFFPGSRYENMPVYTVRDTGGREVSIVKLRMLPRLEARRFYRVRRYDRRDLVGAGAIPRSAAVLADRRCERCLGSRGDDGRNRTPIARS